MTSTVVFEKERWFNPEFLKNNYSLVLSFRNIVDYIEWRNPIIQYGPKAVAKGLRVWDKIREIFADIGWRGDARADILIGGVYDDGWKYQLYANKKVMIPYMPSVMKLVTPDGTMFIELHNKKLYVNILKLLVKAVIVRV